MESHLRRQKSSRDRGPKIDPRLFVQARSASIQASSPSAQVKAAVPQVGDRNWNWEELCPTNRGKLTWGRLCEYDIVKHVRQVVAGLGKGRGEM
jgi:hypothetical protein